MRAEVVLLHRPEVASHELSDEALVVACAKGDIAALGALFDRHQAAVFRFVSRASGVSRNDLDDIVQNTFLVAQRVASRFRGESSARTWLFGIAANEIRHHVRGESRRRRCTEALTYASSIPAVIQAGAVEDLARREDLRRLAAAIEELPLDLRVAFVLCEVEGVLGVEAAKVLGVPAGTLWRRLHEARKALVVKMERSGS